MPRETADFDEPLTRAVILNAAAEKTHGPGLRFPFRAQSVIGFRFSECREWIGWIGSVAVNVPRQRRQEHYRAGAGHLQGHLTV